jgi:hypothetical protein
MRITLFSWMILAGVVLPFFGAGCGSSNTEDPQAATGPVEPPPSLAAAPAVKPESEKPSSQPPAMPQILPESLPMTPITPPSMAGGTEPLAVKPMPVEPRPAVHGNPLRDGALASEPENPMRAASALPGMGSSPMNPAPAGLPSADPFSARPVQPASAQPAQAAAAPPADPFAVVPAGPSPAVQAGPTVAQPIEPAAAQPAETAPAQPVEAAPTQAAEPSPAPATVQANGQSPIPVPPQLPAVEPNATGAPPAEARPAVDPAARADSPVAATRPKHSGIPFDPIKENGPILVDWPKPKLAVVITGNEDGYMEPCGCAGLDRMKGGLSRRYTMIEMLRKQKGWPVVAVDVGGLTKGYGPQTEIKFRFTVDAMRAMGYDAIGFGRNDLRLPAGELVSVAAPPSPFLSANVGLLGFASGVTERTRIVAADGIKVGVTSVLGKSYQREINNQEIEMADPEAVLAQVVPELKKTCNLLILLANATKEESIALAQKFPDFGLVVTSNGAAEPPTKPDRIEKTQSLLIEVGEKAMNAVVLGFYDDPKQPVRYQRVPLDSRFAGAEPMKRLMVAYQDQLKTQGLSGLSLRPVSHPQKETNGDFVGSEKCETCHEKSYAVWKKSLHAKAWKTLLETDPPRNNDPECISCHVTGWHPTNYFPYKSGFLSEKETPQMVGVGCESCHGPGGAHVAAESGGDAALQKKLQQAMVVTKEESQTSHGKWCQNCHDLDNSPDFHFETYWPDVEHYEDK